MFFMEFTDEKELHIVKRDGKIQAFDPNKIRQAVIKAYRAGGY